MEGDEYIIPEMGYPPQKEEATEQQKAIENSIIQEERVANFISQTSPVSSLERINYILQGYTFTAGEWIKLKGVEGISEEMRKDIIQFLTPVLSEDTRMTNLDENQINGIMQTVIRFMAKYLYDAPEEMDINEIDRIFWIVIEASFLAITRSRNGVERNRLYGSLNLAGSLNVQPEKENKDWWKFWR